MRAFILNATSIKVNWTALSQANGYVVESINETGTRHVLSITINETVLHLSPMSTYTISVYSYRDLPSVNSTQTVLRFDGEFVPLTVYTVIALSSS